ncbi:MAG: DUF1553 domain-containing protein [Opitutaceae bacterium]|nr:DUF1553 domain-containing protein [Opitutaceae bacterium]
MPRLALPLAVALSIAAVATAAVSEPARLEFNRDIRPILSENCFHCHGQDANRREAKLRLDDRDNATRDRNGRFVIAPGNPDDSELLFRLLSKDQDEQMPPPSSNKHVTPEQTALLRRWIAEGAVYEKHWAFVPPQRAPLPKLADSKWPRTALDHFVLSRLEREKLAPAAAAAPDTWLRRASFDLTGLPPTPAELDAFAVDVKKRGEAAFTAAADRLLASPHYGERQAIEWLDAARYADTHGFNNDSSRTMWRWRDWVIDAFNTNLPYDRFITEQIAGDLLYPDPISQTPDPARLSALIATGFARNHVINSEGGIIDEEYRLEYVADRVRTLSTAWLGLTMECAKCHDHKFDPIRQKDFYQLSAFFNNVPEHGEDGRVANAVPMIPAPTREQQTALADYEHQLAALDRKLTTARTAWRWSPTDQARIAALAAAARTAAENNPGVTLLDPAAQPLLETGWRADLVKPAPTIPAAKLDFTAKSGLTLAFWLKPDADNHRDVALFSNLNHLGSPADATYGKGREIRLIDGEIEVRFSDRLPVYALILRTTGAALHPGDWRHIALIYAGGKKAANLRLFVDGRELPTRVLYDGVTSEQPKKEFLIGADNAKSGVRWRGALDDVRAFPTALDSTAVHARFAAVALPRALEKIDANQTTSTGPELSWLRDALLAAPERDALWEKHLALQRSLPTAMVMQELPQPRPAFVLNRGNYDAPGEPVTAGVPEDLIAAWPAGAPRNRLGLAQWLTQPNHPLTARVVVNRFWAQLFGTGLVKTLEDFGYQSEWPSHPELIDTLARDFIDGGWNTKALLKTLVLSATYRQSSATTPALVARDPENRLLAHGPRVRLPAELIRDQALAVSGLLSPHLGGPSVYPYQPEKLYEGIVVDAPYPSTKWGVSTGEELYRRSLYTFWKRTIPHPAMTTFDSPDREFCTVRRARTNTPLQALTLWNEPGYLEAARQLGTRMLREGGADDSARVAFAFRLATGRRPSPTEIGVLTKTLGRLRADFVAHGSDAYTYVNTGASPLDAMLAPAELAATTAVASMILSLDETITKN